MALRIQVEQVQERTGAVVGPGNYFFRKTFTAKQIYIYNLLHNHSFYLKIHMHILEKKNLGT